MALYTVTYKDKVYHYRASSATAAYDKFSNRKVYGQYLIWGFDLDLVDADTRGIQWARYFNRDEMREIMITLADVDSAA